MFASRLSRFGLAAAKGSVGNTLQPVHRSFSTARSSGTQQNVIAATVAAVGVLSLLAFGRGSSKEATAVAGDTKLEVTSTVSQTPDIQQRSDFIARLVALEKDVSEIIATSKNRAFVFIKPHAVTEAVDQTIKQKFKDAKIKIIEEGVLSHDVIEKKLLIDTHYGAIASKAVKIEPKDLNVPFKARQAFQKMFGEKWTDVIEQGKVYNAKQICEKLRISGDELEAKWATLKRDKDLIKFGGGFYCGKIEHDNKSYYVINGFYMSMRSKYTKAPAKIHYYSVEWSPSQLTWQDFRGRVLGATDPASAEPNSLRRIIYEKWEELGLPQRPDVGDNGVHASASPFEAFAERCNWMERDPEQDPFGRALLTHGVPKELLTEMMGDAQMEYAGKTQSVFDLLEDLDSEECYETALKIGSKTD